MGWRERERESVAVSVTGCGGGGGVAGERTAGAGVGPALARGGIQGDGHRVHHRPGPGQSPLPPGVRPSDQ